MAYDLEEQESLDELKAWWDKWGNLVTAVITVFCLAYAGYNGWKWYERNEGAKATAAYVQLQNALVQKDEKNSKSIAEGIIKDHPGHVFASLAAFTRAAQAMKDGKTDEARTHLTWIIEKGKRAEYDAIARIRLAGLELDAKNPQAALTQLKAVKPEGQLISYFDRLGDVQLALGNEKEARAAWEKAIAIDRESALKPIVSLKLDGLAKVTK